MKLGMRNRKKAKDANKRNSTVKNTTEKKNNTIFGVFS
jgi:hypothetical protein